MNVDAFVHVSIYGHGSIAMNIHHVDMVLYIDTSTLLTRKPGVGKSTRSLCDIHAVFCSCSLLSVCSFPFFYIFIVSMILSLMLIVLFMPSLPLFD